MRRLGIGSLLAAAAAALVVAAFWGPREAPGRGPQARERQAAQHAARTLPAKIATHAAPRKDDATPAAQPNLASFKVTGTVYEAKEKPCAALVVAFCAEEGSREARSVRTDADGKYVVMLPAGEWEIHAETERKVSTAEWTEGKEGEEEEVDLYLDESAVLFGTVSSVEGRLLEGARIACEDGYERPLARTMTGASGSYRLVIPNWEATVRFSAAGFATKVLQVEPEREDEERRLDVQLAPGAALAGRVLDPDGQPHGGAKVELALANPMEIRDAQDKARRDGEPDGPDPEAQEDRELESVDAITDERGEFAFTSLEPGWYVVTAAAKGRARGISPAVPLFAGEARRVDIHLGMGGTIVGTVRSSRDGGLIADAEVYLDPQVAAHQLKSFGPGGDAAPPPKKAGWTGQAQARTGPDGGFRFEGVEPGEHRLLAAVDGLAPALVSVVASEGKCSEVELRVSGFGRIFGQVALAPGVLVEQCQVTAAHAIPDLTRKATADATGRYASEGLCEGDYTVAAQVTMKDPRARLHPRLRGHRVRLEGGASLQVDIDMVPERTVTGVVRRGGKPLPKQQVLFMGATGRATYQTATTDGMGRYTATQLDAGEHYVWLGFSWGSMVSSRVLIPEEAGVTELDIDVPGGQIHGRVTDAATGLPVGGATVVVSRPGAQSSGYAEFLDRMAGAMMTYATGEYQVDNLPVGRYDVTVAYGGREAVPAGRVEITDGAPNVRLDVSLPKGVSLALHVQDGGGKAVSQATASVRVAETGLPLYFYGNAGPYAQRDGRIVIEGLLPGRYQVTAHGTRFASVTQEVTVGAVSPEPVRFVLPLEASVALHVVDGRRAPVEGATVLMRHEGGGRVEVPFVQYDIDSGRGTTDENGRSRRGRLAPGRYTIDVRLGEQAGQAQVEVAEGEHKEVEVLLR